MKETLNNKLSKQHFCLVKCIFKGMTIPQMAEKICCSQSSVSYHLNQLYTRYKAKNRNEFILTIFGEIIDNYKTTITDKEVKEFFLKKEIEILKKVLKNLIINKKNSELFEYWTLEAQKYL